MSFNIPGYFLDQKTKKLFKIQAHGPFSLKELQKRLAREAEEEEAAIAATTSTVASTTAGSSHVSKKRIPVQQRSPINIRQFLQQRSLNNTFNSTDSNIPFLMTQLKPRRQIQLEGNKLDYNNMLVDLTSEPDYGEMIVSYRTGRMERVGYQVNPNFQLWNAGQGWYTDNNANVSSLQFGARIDIINGQACRSIVGTSGGKLWRYSIPKLPPISEDEASGILSSINSNNNSFIRPQPMASYIGSTEPSLTCYFSMKKDLFWSSSLDDYNDHLIVGGDRAIYQLSSTFDIIASRKINSSIFATHLPKDEPSLCYTGARNGLIQTFDLRQKKQIHLTSKFEQSSSVTQIQSLAGGYELLTVGMDGSVNIWDTRQPVKQPQFKKQRHDHQQKGKDRWRQQPTAEPIRKLKGHINESTHHLGFDIDLENNLLMLAGSDACVRIWSIFNSASNEPLWTSEKFQDPIPAVKFMVSSQYPRNQDVVLSHPLPILEEAAGRARQCPGVILFGALKKNEETSQIQWLTSIK